MTAWEESDIRGKLGMCLTADLSDSLHIRALDIMLIKGRGYQQEDFEKYGEWLNKMDDIDYRRSLGALRDTYLPTSLPENSYVDPTLLDAIATLSYPQQIDAAINLVDKLEWAESVMQKLYADQKPPPDIIQVMKQAEQMLCALRSLLIKLGAKDGTKI